MTNPITSDQQVPRNRIQQWQQKVRAWKKMLTRRMEANVTMKNDIADILKYNYAQNCLDEIEEFQTKSILEDEITDILRMEVADLEISLSSKSIKNIEWQESLKDPIRRLRNDMESTEKNFNALITAFTDFQQRICKKIKE